MCRLTKREETETRDKWRVARKAFARTEGTKNEEKKRALKKSKEKISERKKGGSKKERREKRKSL